MDEVYNPKIKTLEECKALETRIQQLEERIMEVAENIVFEIYEEWEVFRESLADKWK